MHRGQAALLEKRRIIPVGTAVDVAGHTLVKMGKEGHHSRTSLAVGMSAVGLQEFVCIQGRIGQLLAILEIARTFQAEQFTEAAAVDAQDMIIVEALNLVAQEFGCGFGRKAFQLVVAPVVQVNGEAGRHFHALPVSEHVCPEGR